MKGVIDSRLVNAIVVILLIWTLVYPLALLYKMKEFEQYGSQIFHSLGYESGYKDGQEKTMHLFDSLLDVHCLEGNYYSQTRPTTYVHRPREVVQIPAAVPQYFGTTHAADDTMRFKNCYYDSTKHKIE